MEIIMDDFFVYGSSFESCLENLEIVLQRCKDKNLALNWGKFHFMVIKGIVLGHKIYATSLEVDQANISLIKTLIPPTTVKGIMSFLGHVGFYRRFIQDFSKISRPLCRLLEKDANFEFDKACSFAFENIKAKLVIASIMAILDWNKEFEIMCDASDYAMGAVLGQRKFLESSNMLARLSTRLKKTTQRQRKKCWQWSLLVRSSCHTYWDLMSSYTQIIQQSNT